MNLDQKSHYQISLWQDYTIEKNVGPDFMVYYFYPVDTTQKLYGSAGIYFGGHPERIRPDAKKRLLKDSTLVGNLLGKEVNWTIFDYGNAISASTILDLGENDKIAAFAYSNNYSNIDSLIKTLESVKREN